MRTGAGGGCRACAQVAAHLGRPGAGARCSPRRRARRCRSPTSSSRCRPPWSQIDVTSEAAARPRLRIPGLPRLRHRPARPAQPGDDEDEDSRQPRLPNRQQSSGSGFFISADGYMVTNNHVVAERRRRRHQGRAEGRPRARRPPIVGRDESTDLAVLKVATQGQGRGVPLRELREPRQAAGRRLGDHRRQPVRPGRHRHGGHHLGLWPRPGRQLVDLRRLHPDRRADQPGQLGRSDRSTSTAA